MSNPLSERRLPDWSPGIDFAAPIRDVARRVARDPILRAFGAPNPDQRCPVGAAGSALLALHLAATYHRLAVVHDVVEDYRRRARLPPHEPIYLDAILPYTAPTDARRLAESLYRRALTTEPGLAEAHFGYARLAMARGDATTALDHFSRVVSLSPHPELPPHAHLHASAYWHQATLLEDRGDDQASLDCYRHALSRLGSFGVHHVRVAHFFRRLGLIEDAAEHYRKCMDYSHLYFAEFILPPLVPVERAATAAAPEPIYTTSRGEVVVFWEGAYVAVPERSWPAWRRQAQALEGNGEQRAGERLLGRLERLFPWARAGDHKALRRAQSIAALEDTVEPEAAEAGAR